VLRIKAPLQQLLKRLGIYHRLQASVVYRMYWSVANRSIILDTTREVDFYRHLLRGFRSGDCIFDIGANNGYKTDIFLRLGARVVAVDPDEVNGDILKNKFLKYRFAPKAVIVVNHAVSDNVATRTMWIDEPGSAKNSFSQKWVDSLRGDDKRFGHTLSFANSKDVTTTTIEYLRESYGAPFFIKIDVEGHELSVLQGLKRPVPYLSFEVNLPEFRPEGLQCVDLLGNLAKHGRFNFATDCREGLALPEWLGPKEFSQILEQSAHGSLEVFWKTV
jgi:FkbM family methyltransferase